MSKEEMILASDLQKALIAHHHQKGTNKDKSRKIAAATVWILTQSFPPEGELVIRIGLQSYLNPANFKNLLTADSLNVLREQGWSLGAGLNQNRLEAIRQVAGQLLPQEPDSFSE